MKALTYKLIFNPYRTPQLALYVNNMNSGWLADASYDPSTAFDARMELSTPDPGKSLIHVQAPSGAEVAGAVHVPSVTVDARFEASSTPGVTPGATRTPTSAPVRGTKHVHALDSFFRFTHFKPSWKGGSQNRCKVCKKGKTSYFCRKCVPFFPVHNPTTSGKFRNCLNRHRRDPSYTAAKRKGNAMKHKRSVEVAI